MANIYNPTDNQISIQINGKVYSVGANDTLSNVPMEDAMRWKGTHSFITVGEGEAREVSVPMAAAEEPTEVPEEPEEAPEALTEKPKKKAKK